MWYEFLSIRPYQLMCIVCKIGEGFTSDLKDKRLNEILKKVRENPDMPVTLRCNVEGIYRYQNPGKDEDTPEGKLFNIKRDLDILQKLGLVPGSTRPARDLFHCLLNKTLPLRKEFVAVVKIERRYGRAVPKLKPVFMKEAVQRE